jgi:DNA-binding transcriptional regulator YdaS (Cro superfamily)
MAKKDAPYSIKCLRAIEAFVGGREVLAKKLGVSEIAISKWVMSGKVSGKRVLALRELSGNRFSTDELLGAYDATK